MTERRMETVEVYVSDQGMVCLKQPDYGDGESIIALHPSQVDTVVKWMQDAKEEAGQIAERPR